MLGCHEQLVARLDAKGWIQREVLPRRQRRLSLTPQGEEVLLELLPGVPLVCQGVLQGLEDSEKAEFMRLLRKVVQLNQSAQPRPDQEPPNEESGR